MAYNVCGRGALREPPLEWTVSRLLASLSGVHQGWSVGIIVSCGPYHACALFPVAAG